MTEEEIRFRLGVAFARTGIDDADPDDPNAPELFEWHECVDHPNCQAKKGQGCPCSGVPYLSDGVWREVGPVIAEILRAALPAALAAEFTPTELALIAPYLTRRAVEARATSRADEAAALRRLGDAVEEAGRRSAGGT